MENQINYSLLALACGDSYGSYFEMMGLQGAIFDIKKLSNKPVEVNITDDTKMATILLKHYIKYRTIHIEKLSEEYRMWARIDGQKDGIGMHTYDVLIKNEKNKDSQGNGALMRNIPFGLELIKNGYSFENAVSLMNQESAITHKNETIFICNRLALDLAMNGTDILQKSDYKDIFKKLKYGNTAWVIHSLHIVIETLKKDCSFIDGFKYIVSVGGDTDTNCAIYGAIKGYKENICNSLNILDFLSTHIIKRLGTNEIYTSILT